MIMQQPRTFWHSAAVIIAVVAMGAAYAIGRALLADHPEVDSPAEESAEGLFSIVSDWGPTENGLQLRASGPVEIEQGMPLTLAIDLRHHAASAHPRIKGLNLFRRNSYLELALTDPRTHRSWTVAPYDPAHGLRPPRSGAGKYTVPLDGSAIEPWEVSFPLVKLYENLAPARYECHVRFRFPKAPTRDWHGSPAEWRDAGFWHGSIASERFPLVILPETPKVQMLLVPKRLRLRGRSVYLRENDAKGMEIPAVYFERRDADEIPVPVRNGHFIGTRIRDQGRETLRGGPLKPNDVNPVRAWYEYNGGPKKASIKIEIFETASRPEHMWAPGPGADGYELLWTKMFELSFSERQLREAVSTRPDP